MFLKEAGDIFRKIGTLDELSVYWNSHGTPLECENTEDFVAKMRHLVDLEERKKKHFQYVLSPLSGGIKIELDKGGVVPQARIVAKFGSAVFGLHESQFRDILLLVENLGREKLAAPYRKLRPKVSPKEDPLAWFRYVVNAKLSDMHYAKSVWKWPHLRQMIKDRKNYVAIWCKMKMGGTVSAKEKDIIDALDYRLEYDAIVTFRELGEELAERKKKRAKKTQKKNEGKGWFGGWFSSAPQKDDLDDEEDEEDSLEMEEKELNGEYMQDLSRGVEKKREEEGIDDTTPEDVVKLKIDVVLEKGAIHLSNFATHEVDGVVHPHISDLVKLDFYDLSFGMKQRGGNFMDMEVKMLSMNLIDYHTRDGQELEIIGRREQQEPLVHLTVGLAPPPNDTSVKLRTETIDVLLSMPMINRVAKFFTSVESSVLDGLVEVAQDTASSIQSGAMMQLKETINNKESAKLDLDITVEAPNVILPQSFTDPDCARLVAVLGFLRFHSVAGKGVLEEKDGKKHVTVDFFYDKYQISVEGMKLLMAFDEDWRAYEDLAKHTHVVEDINVGVDLRVLTFPTNSLPKIMLSGKLNSPLQANVEESMILHILKVLETFDVDKTAEEIEFDRKKNEALEKVKLLKEKNEREKRGKSLAQGKDETADLEQSSFWDMEAHGDEGDLGDYSFDKSILPTGDKVTQLDVSFELSKVSVLMYQKGALGASDMINVFMSKLSVNFKQNIRSMQLSLELANLGVQDCIQDWGEDFKWILDGEVKGERSLLQVAYTGIPRSSSLYEGVDHAVSVFLGDISVDVNRETVVYLMNVGDSLARKMASAEEEVLEESADGKSAELVVARKKIVSDNSALLLLDADLQSIRVRLNKDKTHILSAQLGGADAKVDLKNDGGMHLSGKVGTLDVTYREGLWRRIARSGGDGNTTLEFQVELYSPSSKKHTGVDTRVTLRVNSLDAVFRNVYVEELAGYFAEMDAMKAKLFEVAAETASDAAAGSGKTLLDITIGNPCVLVPVSSDSEQLVIADFGSTRVYSQFENVGEQELQKIYVKVQGLNVRTGTRGKKKLDEKILSDTNIVLMLTMPEQGKFSDELPKLSIEGRMPRIHVLLSELQLGIVFGVLENNMSERYASNVQVVDEEDGEIVQESAEIQVKKSKREAMHLNFEISEEVAFEIIGKDPIGKFKISKLEMEMVQLENGNMDLDVNIGSLSIFDQRPVAQDWLFKEILVTDYNDGGKRDFIKVEIRISEEEGTLVSCDMDEFKIFCVVPFFWDIVAPETGWLMVMLDKMNKALEKMGGEKKDEAEIQTPRERSNATAPLRIGHMDITENNDNNNNNNNNNNDSSNDSSSVVEGEKKAEASGALIVKLDLKTTEFALVDDMLNKHSPGFIISTGVDMEYKSSPAGDFINVNLTNMKVIKTKMGMDSDYLVVAPWHIALSYQTSPVLQRIDVSISVLEALLSHSDYVLLFSIYEQMMAAISSLDEDKTLDSLPSELTLERTHSKLRIDNRSSNPKVRARTKARKQTKMMEMMKAEQAQVAKEVERAAEKTPLKTMLELLNVNMAGAKIRIVDDSLGHVEPLCYVTLHRTSCVLSDWSDNMKGRVDLSLGMEYFSVGTQSWEPLLRGFKEHGGGVMAKEFPWKMNVNILTLPKPNGKGTLEIVAESAYPISLIVSKDMMETVDKLQHAWGGGEDVEQIRKEKLMSLPSSSVLRSGGEKFHPLVIVNRTGQDVEWVVDSKWAHLSHKSGNNVAFWSPVGMNGGVSRLFEASGKFFNFRLLGREFDALSFDTAQKHVLELRQKGQPIEIVYEVKYQLGSRVIELRSHVQLYNETDDPICVVVGDYKGTIKAQGYLALPIMSCVGELRVFPTAAEETFQWSEPINLSTLEETTEVVVGAARQKNLILTCPSLEHENKQLSPRRGKNKPLTLDFIFAAMIKGEPDKHHHSAMNWKIHFRSPIVMKNLLFGNIEYKLLDVKRENILEEGFIERGGRKEVFILHKELDLGLTIRMSRDDQDNDKYSGWSELASLTRMGTSLVIKSNERDEKGEYTSEFEVVAKYDVKGVVQTQVSLFAPFWLINKTGLHVLWKDVATLGKNRPLAGQDVKAYEESSVTLVKPLEEWFSLEDPSLSKVLQFSGRKLTFEIEKSDELKKPFVLADGSSTGVLDLVSKRGGLFAIAAQVFRAPSKFWRTRIVQIDNRYQLVNKTNRKLVIGQDGTAQEVVLHPDCQTPYHWHDANLPLLVRVKLANEKEHEDWKWSGAFELHEVSLFQVSTVDYTGDVRARILIQTTTDDPITAVILRPSSSFSIYNLENKTDFSFVITQKGHSEGDWVGPNQKIPFVWPELSGTLEIEMLCSEGELDKSVSYSLDTSKTFPPVNLTFEDEDGDQTVPLVCSVEFDGASKLFVIRVKETSDKPEQDKDAEGEKRRKELEDSLEMVFKVQLRGIAVSLVNSHPKELMNLFFGFLSLEYGDGPKNTLVEASIARFQIDNMLYNTVFPVVWWSKTPKQKNFLHVSMNEKKGYEGITFYDGLELVIQEADIRLDEAFLTNTLKVLGFLLPTQHEEIDWDALALPVKDYKTIAFSISDMLYCRDLYIGPIQFNVSYTSCSWAAAPLEGDSWERVSSKLAYLKEMEDVALQLGMLQLDDAYHSYGDFTWIIINHYIKSALYNFYLLLGAVPVIGAPVEMFRGVVSGFQDAFFLPAQGFTRSPGEFGEGVKKASSSLLSGTVGVIFKEVGKVTDFAGGMAAKVTLDDDYKEEREKLSKKQAKHAGQGLLYAGRDVGKGLWDGITGLVTSPIKGAQENGIGGFVVGIGKGVLGVVTKPVVGALDATSQLSYGIKNQFVDMSAIVRLRNPRFFGTFGMLQDYDGMKAEGQLILYTIGNTLFGSSFYVFHYPPLDATTIEKGKSARRKFRILISNKNIFYITGQEPRTMMIKWEMSIMAIQEVRVMVEMKRSIIRKEEEEEWALKLVENGSGGKIAVREMKMESREEAYFVYWKIKDVVDQNLEAVNRGVSLLGTSKRLGMIEKRRRYVKERKPKTHEGSNVGKMFGREKIARKMAIRKNNPKNGNNNNNDEERK